MTDNTNVNVVQMGDELYAMTETDTMHRIDPETLETVGAVRIDCVKVRLLSCLRFKPGLILPECLLLLFLLLSMVNGEQS